MNDSKIVEQYYNEQVLSEWNRIERHPIEFAMTKKILTQYLPPAPAKILDVGGGPGRYAFWLIEMGYEVTLFDLSPELIKFAQVKSKELKIPIHKYIAGNALELTKHVSDKFDAVLLMGPLYHLTDEKERITVVNECIKLMKSESLLFSTFISAYAPTIDMLKRYPHEIIGNVPSLLNYLRNGKNVVSDDNPGFTNAYFQHPSLVEGFMNQFPLEKIGFFTVESILGSYEEILKNCDKKVFDECIDLAMHFIGDIHCRACGEHLMYIGKQNNKI